MDFYWKRLLAWRPETKEERRGAYTVWLRSRDENDVPLPYRVVQFTDIGPSYGRYLSGDLIDDYLAQPGSFEPVWQEQDFGPMTTGRPTYTRCGE